MLLCCFPSAVSLCSFSFWPVEWTIGRSVATFYICIYEIQLNQLNSSQNHNGINSTHTLPSFDRTNEFHSECVFGFLRHTSMWECDGGHHQPSLIGCCTEFSDTFWRVTFPIRRTSAQTHTHVGRSDTGNSETSVYSNDLISEKVFFSRQLFNVQMMAMPESFSMIYRYSMLCVVCGDAQFDRKTDNLNCYLMRLTITRAHSSVSIQV